MQVRDGRWEVGDAGAVTFAIREDAIVLLDVEAAPGWRSTVVRELAHLLEVDFDGGPEEWEFTVHYDNGALKVQTEREIDRAEVGRYRVGEAGEVEVTLDDAGLRLVEVATEQGWMLEIEEETAREIEVEFKAAGETWEFEIERDKSGALEVEIEHAVQGRWHPQMP